MEQTKTCNCFFWPWAYEDKAAFFDRQSEAGWQLSAFGTRTCTLTRNDGVRYRHRLVMLPGAPGEREYEKAMRSCTAARWELAAAHGAWVCLRKPYDAHLPESAFVPPVEQASEDRIEAVFRGRMRALVAIIAVCCVIAAVFAVWAYVRKLHLWQVAFPFGAIVIACLAPFTKMQSWLESKGRLTEQKENKSK